MSHVRSAAPTGQLQPVKIFQDGLVVLSFRLHSTSPNVRLFLGWWHLRSGGGYAVNH